jgi:hypothetical protein
MERPSHRGDGSRRRGQDTNLLHDTGFTFGKRNVPTRFVVDKLNLDFSAARLFVVLLGRIVFVIVAVFVAILVMEINDGLIWELAMGV